FPKRNDDIMNVLKKFDVLFTKESQFLWLPTHLYPNWLCEYHFIPNNTKIELRFARELYDNRILPFTTIFASSDVFIAPELRCSWLSNGLVSLGFNDKVDDDTFIRLDFEIQNLYNLPSPPSDLFYYGIFSNQLIFIPSKPVNYPYLETAKFKTPKLCSFNSLHLLKHIKLCWTQYTFYDDLVIPPESVLNAHIDLGELFFKDVMDHLVAIKKNIVNKQLDYWKRHGASNILFTIINGLYRWLENNLLFMKCIGEIGEQWFIRDLKSTSSKNLAPYGNLLQLCGVYNFILATPTNFKVPNIALKQDNIVNKLCSCVDADVTQNFSHSNIGLERFYDIFFNIRSELIGTCRFLLAATCPHFERAFCADILESKLHEHVFLPH
ncbi:22595_t:CDS:2, partial [Gigaspora margarita]